MSEFSRACRELDDEIDEVAARLVRRGVAPWEAMEQASRSVRHKRATQDVERSRGDSVVRRLLEMNR